MEYTGRLHFMKMLWPIRRQKRESLIGNSQLPLGWASEGTEDLGKPPNPKAGPGLHRQRGPGALQICRAPQVNKT